MHFRNIEQQCTVVYIKKYFTALYNCIHLKILYCIVQLYTFKNTVLQCTKFYLVNLGNCVFKNEFDFFSNPNFFAT